MAEDRAAVECGLAVAHPWLCDAMGHLSTRHIMGMFDDAAYHLFAIAGYDSAAATAERWGWADVRHEIEYRSEITAGALLRVEGQVSALGRSSLTSVYRLLDRADGRECAVMTAKTVCFDLEARRSRPLPDAFRRSAEALFGLDPAAGQT